MESSKTVFLNDFHNDRQPKTAIWPPKPEILIIWKCDRQHRNSNGKPGRFYPQT